MKRMHTILVVLTITLVSLSTLSLSQTKLGIRGGLNLANISEELGGTESFDFEGTPLEITLSQSNRTTFNIGGFVEYWFTPMFAVQINALYNQKGIGIDGDLNTTIVEQGIPINVTVNAEEVIKLAYFSFPVLAKLAFGESNIKPYLIAGPEIGFLLSGKDYAKATSEAEAMGVKVGPYSVELEEDIKESLESFEFAINFGAGLSFALGNIELFADFIYSLGITKINKESFTAGEDIKNQIIMINVGMLFGLNN